MVKYQKKIWVFKNINCVICDVKFKGANYELNFRKKNNLKI